MKKKILVLASNPKGTSNVNVLREIRDLKEAIKRSLDREHFSVESEVAVRQEDLRRYILDVKPQIIHFCGHGTSQGLVLDDENGTAKLVSNEVLVDLLKIYSDRIECVLLNACYSEALADEIAKHINYAIGMNQAVFDDAAIAFSEAFYDALGAGELIERAFEVGKNAVLGKASSRNTQIRKLTAVDNNDNPIEQNQEHLIPVLKKNLNPTPMANWWMGQKTWKLFPSVKSKPSSILKSGLLTLKSLSKIDL